MVDDESREVASEAAKGAPSGAVAPPPRARLGAGRAVAAGAVGGVVVAAGIAAAGYFLLLPNARLWLPDASRVSALDAEANRDQRAIASLDKRLGALEGTHTAADFATVEKRVAALEAGSAAANVAPLEKRVGALEASTAAANVAPLEKRVGALEAGREASGSAALEKRVGALEAGREASSSAALEKRVGALEAGREASGGAALEKRIAALEAANAAETQKIETSAHAVQALSGDLKAIPAMAQRVEKLESSLSSTDLAALAGRVDKLESTPAAPKADGAAAAAVVAAAIGDKLATGAAFPTELAALQALGVDPAKIEPLQAVVDGSQTDRALAAAFEADEPKVLAVVSPKEKETGGVGDRFLAHIRNLVQIHRVGEIEGDDPEALVSQVAANLRRGDLDAALAAFAKLPEPARQAVAAWSAATQDKAAAVAAAKAIREAAVAKLAQGAKP